MTNFFSEAMDDTQIGAQENITIFFFITLVLSTAVMTFIPQIFEERPVLYRELLSKTYKPMIYLFSLIHERLSLVESIHFSIITLFRLKLK